MKLHFRPPSATSRPVLLFCAQEKIEYQPVIVDFASGEHQKKPFTDLNPSCQIPVLEDGDFVLTESSAILKYLADKVNSAAYPKDIKARARVNERMDWLNTGFYREYAYNLIYPQVLPHHKRPEGTQQGTVEWGHKNAERWFKILDESILGSKKYLCGDQITIADYFGAELIETGQLIGINLSKYPNVARWMDTMRALPAWKKVNEAFDAMAEKNRGKQFVTIA